MISPEATKFQQYQISYGVSLGGGNEWFQNGHFLLTMPIYGKSTCKFSPEPRKLWSWILVYSIRDIRSTKCVQMMILDWPLTFLYQGQICFDVYLYGENVEKLVSQNVLKSNARLKFTICDQSIKTLNTIKILGFGEKYFLKYGHSGHLGGWTAAILTLYQSPDPGAFTWNLINIGPSEMKLF